MLSDLAEQMPIRLNPRDLRDGSLYIVANSTHEWHA